MTLEIDEKALKSIQEHGEASYPEEGAGFLLGEAAGEWRHVVDILPIANSREAEARHNRYLITAQDMLHAEMTASKQELDIIGIFHSHPDHPNEPSDFDREWALPWYSYVITSIMQGQASGSRSWRLVDDRSRFEEEFIRVLRSQATED